MSVLRPGLLDGLAVTVVGPADDAPLGAELQRLGADLVDEEGGALVFDAAPAFGSGGDEGLMAMLEAAWAAVLGLAPDLIQGHVRRGQRDAQRAGKLILLAPPPQAGPLARAAADALENLARTLSVEWARFGITTCTVTPRESAAPDTLGELVAYLLSPAGDYFTGCRFEVGALG